MHKLYPKYNSHYYHMMKIKHIKNNYQINNKKKKFLIEHACCVISKKQTLRNIDFGKVT